LDIISILFFCDSIVLLLLSFWQEVSTSAHKIAHQNIFLMRDEDSRVGLSESVFFSMMYYFL
jgi:hypothetical protein